MSLRERLGPLLLVLALGALLYLPGLGREILRHPLEAKYALAAREMVRGGPWLVARLFGELYPDKPPLYFWATAAVAELRGGRLDEVSARLPAVAGGLASLVVTLLLGDALFGPRAGLISAVVLATSGLFFWYARQGHPDQFLIAGVTLACLGLWRSFTVSAEPRRIAWIALAYAAMALAVLSKGLLGLVLPLLAGALYLAVTGPGRAVPRRLGLAPGLPVFVLVVLAWYGPAVARHGLGYLRETLVHQQVERYARSWVHRGPWYQYLGDFATGFLPWSLFVPGAVALAWLGWRAERDGLRAARRAAGAPPADAPAPFLFPLS
ncbi:MAG TPA: glycosyltransferase family 39 protein, partial [Methylomirabilota bacterium]